MSGLDDRDWALLLHRVKEGRCTPFLGAGAAVDVLPLGRDVAKEWAREHKYPLDDSSNLPRVAQYLAVTYDAMFPKETLAAKLKLCGAPDFAEADEPHGVLADLPLPIYMTTNYDDFLSLALKARRRDPVREVCRWKKDIQNLPSQFDAGYIPSKERPVVFHLHGHVDTPKSMVLTEDDYLTFLVGITGSSSLSPVATSAQPAAAPLLPPRIQEAFADATVLFLGYALSDWNFRVLFRALVEYLDRSTSRAHVSVQLLPVSGDMSDEMKANVQRYFDEYFKNLKIRVFWGTCRQFMAELSRRWAQFNGGR